MNKIEKVIEDYGVEAVNEKDKIVVVASRGQKELLQAVIEEIQERIKVLEDTEKLETKEKEKITKCLILENKMLINLIKESIK